MENNSEFQLLKLKVASEIVRSSQAVVAFSRAFYLEEVLIDKINNEVKDMKEEFDSLQTKVDDLLETAHLEDNIVTETNLRVLCSSIQSELDANVEVFEEFEKRRLQAEARRQAKSALLQKLSTNELMGRFESLSLTELRQVQVPEFSCFINESDFGLLEKLNEDWSRFRKELGFAMKVNLSRIEEFKLNDLSTYKNLSRNPSADSTNYKSCSLSGGVAEVPLEEIGKTFANRSGSVLRKFSTLLRRGKRNSKVLSSTSFEGTSEL